VPRKSQSYYSEPCSPCGDYYSVRRGQLVKQNIEGDLYLKNEGPYSEKSIGFVKHLQKGFLKVNDSQVVFPRASLVTFRKDDSSRYVGTIQDLQRFLLNTSPKLRLVDNGAGFSVNDSTTRKTVHFKGEAEVCHYLATHYGMDKVAADKLLVDREVVLFRKQAFVAPSTVTQPGVNENAAVSMGTTGYMPQPGQGTQPGDYNVDEQMLDASADLGDEDLFDTGMLASLADNADIKELLVDMVPNFVETVTGLGRTLLAFSVHKKQMEEYYGREQYAGLLGNVRKVFQLLGSIVYDLKSYVNMN
jgi:hypothetical protein